MAIKLVVAGSLEDHAVLKYALATSSPDAQLEVGSDGYRAIELTRRTHPDVIVVDPDLPGLSGPELVAGLKAAAPGTPIVCWTGHPDVDQATELLRAGASAYLLKEDGPTELVRNIPAVLEGGLVIAPRVNVELAGRFTHSIHRESELTRALAEATMQLQETASSRDKFVANVNHEIRTPVTIVKGIAHLLKSGRLSDEDQEQFVKRMDQAVERLTGLVDEILSVADLGKGKISLQPESADMVALATEVCERMEATYPAVVVERQFPRSQPLLVDPARISEVMEQLMDNACRYSPEGGTVTVSLRRVEEGVMFSVTDSGEGLPREIAARAFHEPFVTGEDILRKERAGLGLGLHLARQLVVLHGGIMWADPLPSGGTRVAFCIPVHSTLTAGSPNRYAPAPQAVAPEPRAEELDTATLIRQLMEDSAS